MTDDPNPRAVPGDNSSQAVAPDRLRAFLERIERVTEEISALTADRSEIFAEAKATGFDTKAMRALLKLRAQDHAQRQEEAAMLRLYADALGMGDIFG